jgi:uncharacterized protein YeaO (DUF488 family)
MTAILPQNLRVKRAYEPADPRDGRRILVDRLWPRGLKKADAAIECWMREVAPSIELRKWFAHEPQRWTEFRRRYAAELREKTALLDELRALARAGPVTLVYAARDSEHNDAVALREALLS